MSYDVSCAACGFEAIVDDVDSVYDLQATHRERRGLHHVFEFVCTEDG
ncbi:MAG: hypothetical protein ABEJ31_00750 [Haloarculaceae archaeon]